MQKNQQQPLLLTLSLFLVLFGSFFVLRSGFVFAQAAVTTLSPEPTFLEGNIIRTRKSGMYYVGHDRKIHPFTSLKVFHSWYPDFSIVQTVADNALRQYQIGEPVCVKQGTWLVQFTGISRVYAVEPGCVLRPLRSAVEATLLFGADWRIRILQLDMLQSNYYTVQTVGVADATKNIVDKDADGVPLDVEMTNGSSDYNVDSDRDGLSDYEEIYYWHTDSLKEDTDGDKYPDGAEVMAGFTPTGSGKITQIPANTYQMPVGSRDGGTLFQIMTPNALSTRPTVQAYPAGPSILRNGQMTAL